ncbi:HNH endonuclease [Paenibacillus lentus]|uniref:Toxin n=1 Tax=Paenibacillus lentus TaxID=1338368 RepID=A0A3Q8S6W2_9BACL|nr:HNH endonuclease [Paenibacillus lentus]AZK48577.1 toxin [Paenibacillus lentus]
MYLVSRLNQTTLKDIDSNLLIAKDNDQFKACTQALKRAIDNGEVPKDIFNEKQLAQIEAGKARIQGLTWHHHQVTGKMQLVVTDTHGVNHLGGNAIWGDGIR